MCTRAGVYFFFFNDTATTEIYTLSLHDALPICEVRRVQFARGGLRGFNVLGGFNQRNGALNDLGGTDLGVRPAPSPDRLYRQPVPEHRVMTNLIDLARPDVHPGRRFDADDGTADLRFSAAVSLVNERGELVDGEEVLDAVAELLGHIPRVVGERLWCLARPPPAVPVLQGLRQVPVVERGERLDADGEQFVDEAVVEVQPLRVGRTGAFGEDARPGDREAVGISAKIPHQRHVFFVAVVVVIGDVTGVAVLDLARSVGEGVPDRLALAVFVPRSLDLVGEIGRASCRERV